MLENNVQDFCHIILMCICVNGVKFRFDGSNIYGQTSSTKKFATRFSRHFKVTESAVIQKHNKR